MKGLAGEQRKGVRLLQVPGHFVVRDPTRHAHVSGNSRFIYETAQILFHSAATKERQLYAESFLACHTAGPDQAIEALGGCKAPGTDDGQRFPSGWPRQWRKLTQVYSVIHEVRTRARRQAEMCQQMIHRAAIAERCERQSWKDARKMAVVVCHLVRVNTHAV